MSTNGLNTPEDTDMAECDGEKVVTMMDVLQEQQDFEEDANAVLGASDDKNCTYAKGYIKRQAIYACMTCCPDAKTDPTKRAGVCLACSLTCHENHDLIELYTKRNFRCDCGNPKFNLHPCQFNPNKSDLNEDNNYNQNYSGLYCVCHRPYPDPESTVEEEMIQCIICEDWLHGSHLEAVVPPNDHYSEMVCKGCMEKNEFLHDYSSFAVIADNIDVDVVSTNDSMSNGNSSDCIETPKGNGDVHMNDKTETNDYISKTDKDSISKGDLNIEKTQHESNKTENEEKNKDENDTDVSNKCLKTDQIPSVSETDNASCVKSDIEMKETVIENLNEIKEENEKVTENSDIVSRNETEEAQVKEITNDNVSPSATQNIIPDPITKEEDISQNMEHQNREDATNSNKTESNVKEEDLITQHSSENNVEDSLPNSELKPTSEEENEVVQDKVISEHTTSTKNIDESKEDVTSDDQITEKMEEDLLSEEPKTVIASENPHDDDSLTDTAKSVSPEKTLLDEDNTDKSGSSETTKDHSDSAINIVDSTETDSNVFENKFENDVTKAEIPETELKDPASDSDHNETSNATETISKLEVTEENRNSSNECNIKNEAQKTENTTSTNEIQNETDSVEKTDNNKVTDGECSADHSNKENKVPNENECLANANENKRKLSTEEPKDTVAAKKVKLDEIKVCVRPKGVKRQFKGATFWPSHFRQKLCTCNECLSMYKDLSVLFLIDPEDTVTAYETLGKQKSEGNPSSQYEKGLQALSSLDRIQQINALTEYNKMRDKLLDFLKSFKERKEIVKEEDIKAFFAGMKPKREPDGVYFCR